MCLQQDAGDGDGQRARIGPLDDLRRALGDVEFVEGQAGEQGEFPHVLVRQADDGQAKQVVAQPSSLGVLEARFGDGAEMVGCCARKVIGVGHPRSLNENPRPHKRVFLPRCAVWKAVLRR
jgi:hypothetical protein